MSIFKKMSEILRFQPLKCIVDPTFWYLFTQKKIKDWKLSEAAIQIQGKLLISEKQPPTLLITDNAFESATPSFATVEGMIKNLNIQENLTIDFLKAELARISEELWNNLNSWETFQCIKRFWIFSFSDLKKYQYRYYVAFPCLSPKIPYVKENLQIDSTSSGISVDSLEYAKLYVMKREGIICEFKDLHFEENYCFIYKECLQKGVVYNWGLRNILVFLHRQLPGKKIKILVTRGDNREFFQIRFPAREPNLNEDFGVTGWETDMKGRVFEHKINLCDRMDPEQLAITSVDLNLQLMKWRLCPSLDLAIIKAQSCLILGTGTLGCNIARGLLGWGINQITFVDSGKVHYSNPVRQSLFTQLQVHRSKVDAAVEQIHTILVGGGQQDHEKLNLMNIQGVDMEIPMPGHAVTQGIQELTLKLEDLIKKHSIVFLLTDSRESRWLPTLLGALHQKIVITVALGFDEFVVMRHGMNNDLVKLEETAEQLGCYFCGDIVSPQDSTSQRSLDQQCTISRPGLSMTASAMAVELLATLLQHPDQGHAPADIGQNRLVTSTSLGIIPHQLRGHMSHYKVETLYGKANPNCVACSPRILLEYTKKGPSFVEALAQNPDLLQSLSGITEILEGMEEVQLEEVDF